LPAGFCKLDGFDEDDAVDFGASTSLLAITCFDGPAIFGDDDDDSGAIAVSRSLCLGDPMDFGEDDAAGSCFGEPDAGFGEPDDFGEDGAADAKFLSLDFT
jgi:hypothetical protein